MIDDASFSFKCHYGASFTTATHHRITSSTENLYSARATSIKKTKFNHFPLCEERDRLETA